MNPAFYWLAILVFFLAFLIVGTLIQRGYARVKSWLATRRRDKAREKIADRFGGARLPIHDDTFLRRCTKWQAINTPQERIN